LKKRKEPLLICFGIFFCFVGPLPKERGNCLPDKIKHGSFSRTFRCQHQWCPQKLIPVEFVLLTNKQSVHSRVTLCLLKNKKFCTLLISTKIPITKLGVFLSCEDLQGQLIKRSVGRFFDFFKNRWFWFFEKINQNQRIVGPDFFKKLKNRQFSWKNQWFVWSVLWPF